jgi:dTMP kinase
LGERLRSLLLDHDKDGLRIGLRAEMLLYMASRAQLVEELIGPALAEGRLVVCDRFLMANVVYQAHAGGLDPGEVWAVGQIATGGVLPDLTLVLDVPPEVAAARRGPARDRMEARTEAYHRAVRAGYLRELESRRVAAVRIDAAADEETVAARILDEVRRALERRAGT